MGVGIFGNVIDTLEVYQNYGVTPQPIRVGANMYAVVYNGAGGDGFVKTFGVSDAGAIDDAVIDTLEFETGNCDEPEIIHIAGEVYAIVYTGPDLDGWVKTVTIGSDGEIEDAVIDSFEFEDGVCATPSVVHVLITKYAIAYVEQYTLPNNKRLLRLDATAGLTAGDIGKVVEGQTTGDTGVLASYDTDLNLLWVTPDAAGDKFDNGSEEITVDGVTCGNMTDISRTVCFRGRIKTIDIADDGTITDEVVDTGYYEEIYNGEYPHIIRTGADIFAITYSKGVPSLSGGLGVGAVKTVQIDLSGRIWGTIDSTTFDTTIGWGRIVYAGNGIYAIGYRWRTAYGGAAEDEESKIKIVTLTISPAGAVSTIIDTEEVATISQDVSAVVYLDLSSLFAHKIMIAYPTDAANACKTYDVDAGGLISLIDSLVYDAVGTASYPRLIRIEETDIYMIVYMDSGNDGMATTYGVTIGTAYPSDAFTRVSGLVHRWSPGHYTLEVFLGDVRTLWDAPPVTKKARTVEPEKAEKPGDWSWYDYPDAWTDIPPRPTPPEPKTYVIPTFPGIVITPDVYEYVFGKPSPTPEEARKITIAEGLKRTVRAAFPISLVKKAWEYITPWEEKKGETLIGEIKERVEEWWPW